MTLNHSSVSHIITKMVSLLQTHVVAMYWLFLWSHFVPYNKWRHVRDTKQSPLFCLSISDLPKCMIKFVIGNPVYKVGKHILFWLKWVHCNPNFPWRSDFSNVVRCMKSEKWVYRIKMCSWYLKQYSIFMWHILTGFKQK